MKNVSFEFKVILTVYNQVGVNQKKKKSKKNTACFGKNFCTIFMGGGLRGGGLNFAL